VRRGDFDRVLKAGAGMETGIQTGCAKNKDVWSLQPAGNERAQGEEDISEWRTLTDQWQAGDARRRACAKRSHTRRDDG